MLTPQEISELSKKPWWSPHDLLQVFNTIYELQSANSKQADLLKGALNQLDAYRERVAFYRNATTKLIG